MLRFDKDYFNKTGYKKYANRQHFKKRAQWLKNNLQGSILEVGCAYGFMVFEGRKINLNITGIDISPYAISQSPLEIKEFVKRKEIKDLKVNSSSIYDWIISWNVLDCLIEEELTETIKAMNTFSINQLHILTMAYNKNTSDYKREGYLQKTSIFWRKQLPGAYLICSECGKVYNPANKNKFSSIPLIKEKVSQ